MFGKGRQLIDTEQPPLQPQAQPQENNTNNIPQENTPPQ